MEIQDNIEPGFGKWLRKKFKERTTLDGVILIVICTLVILFGPIVKYAAYAGLAWGVYTLVKDG